MKKLITVIIALLFWNLCAAQMPHVLKNGDIADAEILNKNFDYLNEDYKYNIVRANGKIIGKVISEYGGWNRLRFNSNFKEEIIRRDGRIDVSSYGMCYFQNENCQGEHYTPVPMNEDIRSFHSSISFNRIIDCDSNLYYALKNSTLYKFAPKSRSNIYGECLNNNFTEQYFNKLIPNNPDITGIETYPFPLPITIDGFSQE